MCEKCEPFGGLWKQTETGLCRCVCAEGKRLSEIDQARFENRSEAPRITKETATMAVEMLAAIAFFPRESGARMLIAEEIRSMCRTSDEALWLVQRVSRLYDRWPGVREMRLVYCSKHRPLDGYELIGGSETFPEGIPPEKQIEAPVLKALPAGRVASAAESVDGAVADIAKAKRMNLVRPIQVRDIPILPPGKRITQADIDAAVNVHRDKIARGEYEDN